MTCPFVRRVVVVSRRREVEYPGGGVYYQSDLLFRCQVAWFSFNHGPAFGGLPDSAEAVTVRTVTSYLQDIDDQLKSEREETMLSMWLACYSQTDIAEEVGVHEDTVSEFLQKIRKTEELPKSEKSAISHDTEFNHQIYSVWNFPKATNAVKHFGNIPPEIIDNLLYYYAEGADSGEAGDAAPVLLPAG